MKSEKEILDALYTLQEVCMENYRNCTKCLLRNANDDCGVITDSSGNSHNSLTEWDLKNLENPRLILN